MVSRGKHQTFTMENTLVCLYGYHIELQRKNKDSQRGNDKTSRQTSVGPTNSSRRENAAATTSSATTKRCWTTADCYQPIAPRFRHSSASTPGSHGKCAIRNWSAPPGLCCPNRSCVPVRNMGQTECSVRPVQHGITGERAQKTPTEESARV